MNNENRKTMTPKMIKRREGILMLIAQGYPDTKISQMTGYSRPLISKVRGQIKTMNLFE